MGADCSDRQAEQVAALVKPDGVNGGKLSFNVTVKLEELASGLDDLSDDQLQAIFKEVPLRPDLLDDLVTLLD